MNEEKDRETPSSHEQPESKVAVSAPSLAAKEHPKQPPGPFAIVALCLAVSFGASLATIVGYDRWYAKKIVAVDIKGYIARQRDDYLAGKLNDDELRKSFDRLEAVILAIPKNRVVIMGDAVVRNAETVTP
jgi:hypothetical protein